MACRILEKKSCISHLFKGGPQPGCSDRLLVRIIESRNFFVLGPILVKFHIRTRLIESFPWRFGFGGAPKESCTSHLTPTEVWRSAFSTTWEGRRVSSEVPAYTCKRVFGVGKIWRPCDLRSRSYERLYTHTFTGYQSYTKPHMEAVSSLPPADVPSHWFRKYSLHAWAYLSLHTHQVDAWTLTKKNHEPETEIIYISVYGKYEQ